MNKDQLLAEIDDILRLAPSVDLIRERPREGVEWLGRAAAAIVRWDGTKTPYVDGAMKDAQAMLDTKRNFTGYDALIGLLQRARADLRMDTGRLSVAISQGQVFEYFDEIRKAIEIARTDLLFADPYLDAEFVARYLPHVHPGTVVRLLTEKKVATLLPAVDMFTKQSGLAIQVRSSATLHDRFLFIDGKICYLSGASFKDGAKNAPATLTQIVDAFQSMFALYEQLWNSAKVERA